MDILQQLTLSMTKDEARHYKILSSRTQTAQDRKDWALFDNIRKTKEDYSDETAFELIYPNGSSVEKNAFYRLKNRLMDDVYKSQMMLHFLKDDNLLALNFLSLAKLYFEKSEFKIANYLARKAERKAQANEDYELLDVIYSFHIRLSLEIVTENPSEFIAARRKNQEKLNLLREIDDLLATVNYNLKISQNFETQNPLNVITLKATIEKLSGLSQSKESSKLRLKLYQAISKLLLQTRDYKTLADYSQNTFDEFMKEGLFTKTTHENKLQILTYIVNSLFKNQEYEKSLAFSQQLGLAIEEFNKLMYDKYVFFYYNSLVINYSQLNVDKAIELLEELKVKDVLKRQPFYEVFIYLNLAIFWYQKKSYKKATRELGQLYVHESYKNVAPSLRQKIAFADMIIRFEIKDYDFVERRREQIKRDFEDLLNESIREKDFLTLVLFMAKLAGVGDFKQQTSPQIKHFLTQYPDQTDADIISYNEWLNSKL